MLELRESQKRREKRDVTLDTSNSAGQISGHINPPPQYPLRRDCPFWPPDPIPSHPIPPLSFPPRPFPFHPRFIVFVLLLLWDWGLYLPLRLGLLSVHHNSALSTALRYCGTAGTDSSQYLPGGPPALLCSTGYCSTCGSHSTHTALPLRKVPPPKSLKPRCHLARPLPGLYCSSFLFPSFLFLFLFFFFY